MKRLIVLGAAATVLASTGCRNNCGTTSGLGLFNRAPACAPTTATPVSYGGGPSYGGAMMMPAGYGTLTSRPIITGGVPTVPYAPGTVAMPNDAVTELPYPAPAIAPTPNPTRAVGLPK